MNEYTASADIFDSTLRDGAQGEGICFSVEDKLKIVRTLDALGVAYIEAGNPGSNPKDPEFFARAAALPLQNARLVAFGATRRKNTLPHNDASLHALLNANTPAVAVFGKCWDLHATEVLGVSLDENLLMINQTCGFLKANDREVIFDAEHFFDGYKNNPGYALHALEAALSGGADALVLCDTNGGSFPEEIAQAVKAVAARYPDARLGIHCHNDGGLAVANSIAAVDAGTRQVQGTLLGIGERCGNANLATVIANLQIKKNIRCIPPEKLELLTVTARSLADISNLQLSNTQPYVGLSAFAHKAGMHADGVLKLSRSFEHIPPEAVGNERRFLMSEMTGRTAVLQKVRALAPGLDRDSPEIRAILERLKALESAGYQFEGAEGSFELLVRRELFRYKDSFELVSYKILDELPPDNHQSATATLKIKVDGRLQISAAEGDGPVNALDKALREALGVFYPVLSDVHLIDYKVRVMEPNEATAATVRVLITSSDGENIWTTVGVSPDVIEASWIALKDSIEYKLHNTVGARKTIGKGD